MQVNKPYEKDKMPKVRREEVQRISLDYSDVDIDANLDRKTMVIAGDKKIGKTVTANRAGAFFLKFEAGHSHIRHKGVVIKDWNHMRSVAREIILQQREGKFPFDKIAIDTLGECYKMCTDWILQKYGLMHEGDMGHGKGYGLIGNAFREVIMPLSNAGLGVMFLCHTEDKEQKEEGSNETYVKAVPDMPKGCRRVIGGMVDLILYFTVRWNAETEKWERVIKTSPSKFYEAGVRYPEGWSRRLPPEIPMSWEALKNAWDAGRPGEEPEPQQQEKPRPPPEKPQQETRQDNGSVQGSSRPPQQQQQRRTGTKLGN